MAEAPITPIALRRTRERPRDITFESAGPRTQSSIAQRVIDFYRQDRDARHDDRARRAQRYAKFRQWTEGAPDGPWSGSSDVALPDMTTDSLRTQDTLHNAVMSGRPPVSALALRKEDANKEQTIDRILDAQFFLEQPGEKIVEELADEFTNDGVFTAYVPWVREKRPIRDVVTKGPIPPDLLPLQYFQSILQEEYPDHDFEQMDEEGWDWEVSPPGENPESFDVRFYTVDDGVEMVVSREAICFDGPRVFVKEYEEVFYPHRSANLQMPGPSNPGGAAHVILKDKPTIDELRRLTRDGFYDLIDETDLSEIDGLNEDTSDDEDKQQTDDMQGTDEETPFDPTHRPLTRLMCFDLYDIDGDGQNEDVIFWVLVEKRLLLKAKRMSEMFPFRKPRRPFAEASYLPVKGRREGISLLELMEGLHDWNKKTLDLAMDGGELGTFPFGAYRPSSSVKPEVMRLSPLDLMPLSDPSRDIKLLDLSTKNDAFGINVTALIQQMRERLSLQGDLQLGRVPIGRSSALRTLGGMQTILAQGEARPERILRRFFMGLTDIFRMMHELNRRFLPDGKKFRITGVLERGEDPYITVKKASELDIDLDFSFNANVQNASKSALAQSLQQAIQLLINPLMLQMGITDANTIYRLARDFMQAIGQMPEQYVNAPSPEADLPRIMAEDAISAILGGGIPNGVPSEGAANHLARINEIMAQPARVEGPDGKLVPAERIALFRPEQVEVLRTYMEQTAERAAQEAQQQQRLDAAQQFSQQQGGGNGREPQPPDQGGSPTTVEQNELLDETLPGARGAPQ